MSFQADGSSEQPSQWNQDQMPYGQQTVFNSEFILVVTWILCTVVSDEF